MKVDLDKLKNKKGVSHGSLYYSKSADVFYIPLLIDGFDDAWVVVGIQPTDGTFFAFNKAKTVTSEEFLRDMDLKNADYVSDGTDLIISTR